MKWGETNYKNFKFSIIYFLKRFNFLKIYFSPFKPPKIRFYFGKLRYGTPYFYPRKWVKSKNKPGYLTAIPKNIGFDFVSLGWKTKWKEDDYRFEWSPMWSFVFFKWQVCVIFKAPIEFKDAYWEAWLYYNYETLKTKSKTERIKECRNRFPQLWRTYKNKNTITIDYYDFILKKRYENTKPGIS